MENDDEWHAKLPDELIPADVEMSKRSNKFESFAEEYIHKSLLTKSQNPALQFNTKVKDKVLLLDEPIPNYKLIKERSAEKRKQRRKKTLSRKEQRALGLHIIPPEIQNWNHFVDLHEMWKEYIQDVMSDATTDAIIYARLVKADFHGALMTGIKY